MGECVLVFDNGGKNSFLVFDKGHTKKGMGGKLLSTGSHQGLYSPVANSVTSFSVRQFC